MIKPVSSDYLTLEDFLASNSAHTVIGYVFCVNQSSLLDVHND